MRLRTVTSSRSCRNYRISDELSHAPDLVLVYRYRKCDLSARDCETSHDSSMQLFFNSQLVALGLLLVENLTIGVEHSADILADARDFAFKCL